MPYPAYRLAETILNHTLTQHRVGNLYEACDVGATYVVGLLAFAAVFNAGMVNIQHDVVQARIHFLRLPADDLDPPFPDSFCILS